MAIQGQHQKDNNHGIRTAWATKYTCCAPGVNGTKVTESTKTFVLGQEESMGERRVN